MGNLGDGTKLDGRLQDILNELSGKEREDEEAEVFIRTRDMLVVSGIDEEIFDRVTLSPDEEVFDPEKAYYVEWRFRMLHRWARRMSEPCRQSWSM